VPNSAGMLFPGVDVRGDLDYVVAPGSNTEATADGKTATGDYIVVGRPDLMPVVELAEAPMWLIKAAWRAGNKSRAWGTFEEDNAPTPPLASDAPPDDGDPPESDYEVDTEAQIERARVWLRDVAPIGRKGEDGRATTRRVIQHLGDIGLTPRVAYDLLTEPEGWDATKSEPPWCRDEENRRNLETLVYDMVNKRDRPLGSGVHRVMIEDCFVADTRTEDEIESDIFKNFLAARKRGVCRDYDGYIKLLGDQRAQRTAAASAKTLAKNGEAVSLNDDWRSKAPAALTEGVSLDDFCAYMPAHAYIFKPSREFWPGGSVNARIPPIALPDKKGEPIRDKNGNQKKGLRKLMARQA
jgi:hypothetical protein